ncbi:hypothetical protein [Pectobacterium phage Jarilo]|uniref:Uncharacterized protein n=1 Tax=Pectobacterium phage Jarilo TaxID=2163634 RepID=A0A2S1GSX1_9CAUD|nr:hypothetical protein HOT17_gp03 [Pectobacterium phage Jarilo]AWD92484.1 hypothetical protein [Pectobacterium phage Jarilo]
MHNKSRTVYGLTRQAMSTYRSAMLYGASHDKTMKRLKALYDHNRMFHEAACMMAD